MEPLLVALPLTVMSNTATLFSCKTLQSILVQCPSCTYPCCGQCMMARVVRGFPAHDSGNSSLNNPVACCPQCKQHQDLWQAAFPEALKSLLLSPEQRRGLEEQVARLEQELTDKELSMDFECRLHQNELALTQEQVRTAEVARDTMARRLLREQRKRQEAETECRVLRANLARRQEQWDHLNRCVESFHEAVMQGPELYREQQELAQAEVAAGAKRPRRA